MINQIFKEKFKFTSNYFETLLQDYDKTRFPQSIVFEGSDIYGQYFFALELARNLNCLNDGSNDCECINCKWIRDGKHPAVNIVSQLDFKPSDDTAKTVISTKQAAMIYENLGKTSDYHRFFIFLDAKSTPMSVSDAAAAQQYSAIKHSVDEDRTIGFLNQKTFNSATPNALLKSVEEPPSRTTFVFLTKNSEDLMNTIVSRSQVFKLPSSPLRSDTSLIENFLKNYPDITLAEGFDISQSLADYIKESQADPKIVLDGLQEFLAQKLKANLHKTEYANKIKRDIVFVQNAKEQLSVSMSPKNVFDTLFIKVCVNKIKEKK